MSDLIQTFPPLVLSGYLGLSFYRYRLRQGFARLNGEKFIVELFVWGLVSHILFTLAKHVVVTNWGFLRDIPQAIKLILIYAFYSLSGLLFGGILSHPRIRTRIIKNNEKFITSKYPAFSNEFEEDMVNAIYLERILYILETQSKKVYVGYFMSADIDDYTQFEEKIIKFKPILSGKRLESQKIEYSTEYYEHEKLKKVLFSSLNEAELDEYVAYLEDDKNVVIFIREIISYRKLDADLLKKFHSELLEPSK